MNLFLIIFATLNLVFSMPTNGIIATNGYGGRPAYVPGKSLIWFAVGDGIYCDFFRIFGQKSAKKIFQKKTNSQIMGFNLARNFHFFFK